MNELQKILKKAEYEYNKALVSCNSGNITNLCYAEGYLDCIKEVIKWTEQAENTETEKI